jgi:hypothetical protein
VVATAGVLTTAAAAGVLTTAAAAAGVLTTATEATTTRLMATADAVTGVPRRETGDMLSESTRHIADRQ